MNTAPLPLEARELSLPLLARDLRTTGSGPWVCLSCGSSELVTWCDACRSADYLVPPSTLEWREHHTRSTD